MIRVSNLKKGYGPQLLFDDVAFSMQPGERLGIVGRNGHGKSTLFKILIGEEHEDSGEIFIPKNYRIGHLSQHLSFTAPTILEEVCLALPELEGGWKEEYKAEEMLGGLGFAKHDLTRSPAEFSGGYQIRLNLAKLLLSDPNLLLLDEPTNYLDIVAVRWLGRFLREWEREMMIITHDREFMNSVTTHSMAIHRQKAKKLEGTTEKLYAQIIQEEEIYEKTRVNEGKQRREIEKFVTRFRAQASKAKAVQSRVKLLEKMEVKTELSEIQTLDFSFRAKEFPGKFIAHIEDLSFAYNPDDEPLFKDLNFSIGKTDRIAVIGPNGKGKTTLLSLLAGERQPITGSITVNANTSLAYFGQTNISRLNFENTVEDEFLNIHPERNRAVARSIAGLMMFEGDQALKKIRFLSGGERSRVLLGKILLTPSNCLLLDEPTNHLDMESIESLMEAVEEFPGAVVIVTHSEELLRRLPNRLVVFDRGKAVMFEGTYDDFLKRVGWEGEEDENAPVQKQVSPGEESQTLRKAMRKVEKRITDLEEEITQIQSRLSEASTTGDAWKLADLSKEMTAKQDEVNTCYEELQALEDKGR